jgi:hypothetical protein
MLVIRLRACNSLIAIHALPTIAWPELQRLRAAVEHCGRYVLEVR